MCLAVPGKIMEMQEGRFGHMAKVSFGGVVKQASLAYVPEAKVGDYVMVHTGFAISIVDEAEAAEVWGYLQEMAALAAEEKP
ncbi:MAG: HypC/HybG/HupF family hydrogenase formation chaperone [Armatimonadetes bacterium]|nr:HypC/HybG/HupF family hydrogenase formation chaperone [Armatimonadota bacterium]